MREKFVEKSFSPASETMIGKLNAIIAEYEAQGYRLSLRQLYYQMVARDLIELSITQKISRKTYISFTWGTTLRY